MTTNQGTDNDPQLQRFAEFLAAAPNACDVIREALRLYLLYQDGALPLPDDLEALDSDVRVEDIFWVLERAMSLNVRTGVQNQAWRTLPDFGGL